MTQKTAELTVSTGRSALIPVRKVLYGKSDVENISLILLHNSRLTVQLGCLSCAFIVGSNAGYTRFRGSVKGTGYPLQSPVSPSIPLSASPCAITFQLESTSLLVVNGRVHLYRRGASVHSTTGSRGVRISGSNAGYTMF